MGSVTKMAISQKANYPGDEKIDEKLVRRSVFSAKREIRQPHFTLARTLRINTRLKMKGQEFLAILPDACAPAAFFDPQYRGLLDKQAYGNEGERQKQRSLLPQMTDTEITQFIRELDRVLMASGHLFLWMDKFHLCSGFTDWLAGTRLNIVDMVTWDKKRMGMGYRTRRVCEYLVIIQKQPARAKGVWSVHTIPDVWGEKVNPMRGVHPKPVELQARLIEAVSHPEDLIIDPAAGSFSVLEACRLSGRHFLGCDLNG